MLLGLVARASGEVADAQLHLLEALRLVVNAQDGNALYILFAMIALLLADQGKVERAVELYALASRRPSIANSRWYEDVAGRHLAALAAALPPDVVAAASERGRVQDLGVALAEQLAELERSGSAY